MITEERKTIEMGNNREYRENDAKQHTQIYTKTTVTNEITKAMA